VRAVESIAHHLMLAVRVDDHFSGVPWPGELAVTIDSQEPPIAAGRGRTRHADGTYRFLGRGAGPRQVSVAGPEVFTWTATTAVTVPRTTPLVVEVWPSARAALPAGTLAIRGRLVGGAVTGQEVRIELGGPTPPPPPPPALPVRNRRARADASGEFVFVVAGPSVLIRQPQPAPPPPPTPPAPPIPPQLRLVVTVPGRTLASIQILDGATNPTMAPDQFLVSPGRETRALFNLT
jgi:hypothetical protein